MLRRKRRREEREEEDDEDNNNEDGTGRGFYRFARWKSCCTPSPASCMIPRLKMAWVLRRSAAI